MFYHAECLGRDKKQLLKDRKEKKPFYCNWANPFDMFAKKCGDAEDDLHFQKIEQQFQDSLQKARETNSKKMPKRSIKHQHWWDKKNKNVPAPKNGLPTTKIPKVTFEMGGVRIRNQSMNQNRNTHRNNRNVNQNQNTVRNRHSSIVAHNRNGNNSSFNENANLADIHANQNQNQVLNNTHHICNNYAGSRFIQNNQYGPSTQNAQSHTRPHNPRSFILQIPPLEKN